MTYDHSNPQQPGPNAAVVVVVVVVVVVIVVRPVHDVKLHRPS